MGEKENGHQNPSSPAAVTADAGSATSASPPPLELQLPITAAAAASKNPKKLTLLPLIFFIYFEVAGGPSGAEPAVKAAGPLLANLGFLIFPFIWSVPEALITAELSTAFPGNGGYVIWAHRAFGPFWGSAMGLTKFSASVINMASFPALAVDYLRRLFPIFSGGAPRTLALLLSTLAMSLLNYSGLSVVGYASIILGCVSLCPFILMPVIAIPKIRPHRWLRGSDKKTDWNLFFNTLFWNLNFWDNVSTVAGEVDNARKIIPRALFASVLFICATYLIPLLAITGSVAVPQEEWTDGFFADAAEMVAGKWLKIWIEIGAVLSAVGLYEAQLSSCAYGMLGMADLGFLPRFFASRAAFFGTPWVGILLSTAIAIAASFMGFSDIIRSANFVYSLGMLLEFASFVWLRRKSPEIKRPYRVPLGTAALAVMCLVPSGLLVYIMATATKVVYLVSGVMMVVVAGLYFLIKLCKARGWLRFSNSGGEIGDEG